MKLRLLNTARRPRIGVFYRHIALLSLLILNATAAAQTVLEINLPAGEGRELIVSKCSSCHALSRVVTGAYGDEEWRSVLQTMIGFGVKLSPSEESTLVKYLSQNFPSQGGAAVPVAAGAANRSADTTTAADSERRSGRSNVAHSRFVPVTQEDLNGPDASDWLMLGGNMQHWSYSSLDQINRKNVASLRLVWARQLFAQGGRAEASPIVRNGIMYLINPFDVIQALDAINGDLIWEYDPKLSKGVGPNGLIRHIYSGTGRGLAIYGDKIFTVNSDNTVVALDARSGEVVWRVYRGGGGYVANTSGPIVANGIVVAGGSCQTAPFSCYVTGHDVGTGKELWRNLVVPLPGETGDETWGGMPFERRWCSGVWGQIVYDPIQNLVHYGSSGICPASDWARGVAGKNATLAGTNTRWAVRPETGELVWRRQLLPQDNWDQECTFEMMIINTPMHPNPNAQGMLAANPDVSEKNVRTLAGMPCKNPVFWALEAQTGRFFYARETLRGAQNIYETIDPVTGVATMNQDMVFNRPGQEITWCSSSLGGRGATVSPAYFPKRNLMIQPTANLCSYTRSVDDREPSPEHSYNVVHKRIQNPNVPLMTDGQYPVGQITAVDVATGNTVWTYQQRAHNYAPTLATAGGLVFNGDAARYFFALDAESGQKIWQVRLGSMCCGYPVSYAVDGRQYIAVVAGYGRSEVATEVDNVAGSNMIYVFALPESAAGRAEP